MQVIIFWQKCVHKKNTPCSVRRITHSLTRVFIKISNSFHFVWKKDEIVHSFIGKGYFFRQKVSTHCILVWNLLDDSISTSSLSLGSVHEVSLSCIAIGARRSNGRTRGIWYLRRVYRAKYAHGVNDLSTPWLALGFWCLAGRMLSIPIFWNACSIPSQHQRTRGEKKEAVREYTAFTKQRPTKRRSGTALLKRVRGGEHD